MRTIHLGRPRTFAHGADPIPNPRDEEEEEVDDDDYEEEPEKPETD